MGDELQALAGYVYEMHERLGRLLLRDLNDATDAYYRPHQGGLLEEYLKAVDDMGQRFGCMDDDERFYPKEKTNG